MSSSTTTARPARSISTSTRRAGLCLRRRPFVGDGVIYQPALRHDSRNDLYRTPFGAQPTDADVTLRLRTAANDVEQVTLLWGSVSDGVTRYAPLQAVAADDRYAWWETTINTGASA
jgi:hypothetical protein